MEALIPAQYRQKVREALAALTPEEPVSAVLYTNTAGDGSLRWVKWTNRAIFNTGGGLAEYLSIGEDVTEQKQYQDQLEYLSLHDPLTGLFNKAYYDSELRRLEGGRDYPVAIISADLNDLKKINDTHGHKAGDRVLKNCAEVLKTSIRKGDVLARVGGDEFVIVMPRTDRTAGEGVLKRIYSSLEIFNQKPGELPIGLSLGLAVSAGPEEDLEETFIEADRIMYRQKPRRD